MQRPEKLSNLQLRLLHFTFNPPLLDTKLSRPRKLWKPQRLVDYKVAWKG